MKKPYVKPEVISLSNVNVVKKCSKCGKEFVVPFGKISVDICDKCRNNNK